MGFAEMRKKHTQSQVIILHSMQFYEGTLEASTATS